MNKCRVFLIIFVISFSTIEYGKGVCGEKGITSEEIKQMVKELSIEKRTNVKAGIIEQLGNLKVKEATPEIIIALHDKEWMIRWHACEALGKIGDKRGVFPLIERLQDRKENWSIQVRAAKSLVEIGDPTAFEHLINALKYECAVDRKQLYPPIQKSVGTDDEILEKNYVGSIVDLCSSNRIIYVPLLFKYLKEEKQTSKFRFYLAKILGHLGQKDVVPILIEYLEKSPNGLIREDVAEILGNLGDKRAIEPLKKSLKDNYICMSTGDVKKNYGYVVRLAAYRSLLKLGIKVEKRGNEYKIVEE